MANDETNKGQAPKLPPLKSSVPAGGARPASAPARPAAQAPPKVAPPKKPDETPAQPQPEPASAEVATAAPPPPPAPAKPAQPTGRVIPTVKARQDKPPENDQGIWRMSRKNFLNVAGWMAFMGFLVTATLGAIRLMVPRVLYEAPSAFKAGYPEEYIVGEVDERYKDEFRVWIVREPDGFYALSAICTHLGCTPRWLASESKFKCPCHGSGFQRNGINFEGPAPRPLERLKISLADDGRILIDRNIKFLFEKQEWTRPDAYLRYG